MISYPGPVLESFASSLLHVQPAVCVALHRILSPSFAVTGWHFARE